MLFGGNPEILKTLLRYGNIKQILEIKSALEHNTPLHVAASIGNWELILPLMQHGFDVQCQNNLGLTPLAMARQCGYFDIAKQMEGYNGFVYCRLGCGQSMPLHDLEDA